MKKTFKKMISLVLALTMVLAMGLTAFAADGDPVQHTITVTGADQKEEHTYEAYQVFAGTFDTTSNQLKGITWGEGVNGDALLAIDSVVL